MAHRGRPAPFIGPAALDAVAGIVQDGATALRRWELRQLFQSLGVSAELYAESVAGTVDWPPLNMVLPLAGSPGQLHVYPQPGESAMLRAPFARVLCGRTP